MKKILVILAALFILAGGAVAALKWIGLGPFEPKQTAAKEEPKKPEAQTIFIDMDPIMVPLLQGNA
ncbi:MAG: hypothetical protein VW338_12440, partial [Rhodospirillaceae bacterium]